MTLDVVVGPPVLKGAVHFAVADSDTLAKGEMSVFVWACLDPDIR